MFETSVCATTTRACEPRGLWNGSVFSFDKALRGPLTEAFRGLLLYHGTASTGRRLGPVDHR